MEISMNSFPPYFVWSLEVQWYGESTPRWRTGSGFSSARLGFARSFLESFKSTQWISPALSPHHHPPSDMGVHTFTDTKIYFPIKMKCYNFILCKYWSRGSFVSLSPVLEVWEYDPWTKAALKCVYPRCWRECGGARPFKLSCLLGLHSY